MHLKIESEEDLIKEFKELMHISVNMRYWQKQWKEHYGAHNRVAKEKWEERYDNLLEKLNATYQKPSSNGAAQLVKIEFINP
jgi:hypothetical protein